MLPTKDWNAELPLMLQRQDPEDSHLDYKGRIALLPIGRGGGGIDKQKRAEDISKDVSSFLNSDGGTLIYGIRQDDSALTTGGSPIPISQFDPAQDGYDRSEIDKETIENLITSNIQPRPGAELFQVVEVEMQGRIIFVVEVAKGSTTAYQAKDFRYYKRFHYKEEPMEHYEIEMVRNRAEAPQLEVVAGFTETWNLDSGTIPFHPGTTWDIPIHTGIQNTGRVPAEVGLLEIGIMELNSGFTAPCMLYAGERNIKFTVLGDYPKSGETIDARIRWHQIQWNPNGLGINYQPLFQTIDPCYVAQFNFQIPGGGGVSSLTGIWFWRVQAPHMHARQGAMLIDYRVSRGTLKMIPVDWPFEVSTGT